MRCYRRKGGFREKGDPVHCTDRVRLLHDGSVEYVYESGRVSRSTDPQFAATMALRHVEDGHWEACEDKPFKQQERTA